jgi:sRNA-binding regulator protein Hfq
MIASPIPKVDNYTVILYQRDDSTTVYEDIIIGG